MEVLGARPISSMSDPDKVSALDAAMAERARLDVFILQLIADFEQTGYPHEIGAADTARFLSKRYRIDLPKARRTVRFATTLDKHPATAAALPDPTTPFPNPATAHPTADDASGNDASGHDTSGDDADDVVPEDASDNAEPAGNSGGSTDPSEPDGWRVHPDQAEAILAVLAKVPATVPVENVDFAEQRLIDLAATHTPQQLRDAGKPILAILDPDGPEPSEKRAYARESLTWKKADQGVKFQGFLACENAELFRTVIHNGSKPRKTIDGEPDPRPYSKRQADALTTALTMALNHRTPGPRRAPGNPDAAADTSARTDATPRAGSDTGADTGDAVASAAAADRDPSAHADSRADTAADATTAAGHGSRACTDSRAGADVGVDARANAEADAEAGDVVENAGTVGTDGLESDVLQPALPELDTPPADQTSAAEEPPDGTHPPARTAEGAANPGAEIVAGHGPKTHISVTIDFNDLKNALTHATGTMMFGDTLSAATIRRLACDAEILPIVLGSKSQPLDVGTTQRLVTQPIRRALNVRDKGCVACGAPPTHCEAHHLQHWIDGGPTAVSNLVLLCKRDHIDLHSGHWTIQIIDDIVHVTRPTWADPTPIPPHKYQPPHLPDQAGPFADRSPATDPTNTNPNRHLSVVRPNPPEPDTDEPPPTSTTPTVAPWADEPLPQAAPAPVAPWADEPLPTATTAPTAPWADEPLPARATPPVAPWADEPPPTAAPAPVAPWTDEPIPQAAPTPVAPWADEPMPVAGGATAESAPWSVAGFDPWGEAEEDASDSTATTDPSEPTTRNGFGSVA